MSKIIQRKRIVRKAKTMLRAHKSYPRVRKQMRGIVSVSELGKFTRSQDRKSQKAESLRRQATALDKTAAQAAGKMSPRLVKSVQILRAHLKKDSPKIYREFTKKK